MTLLEQIQAARRGDAQQFRDQAKKLRKGSAARKVLEARAESHESATVETLAMLEPLVNAAQGVVIAWQTDDADATGLAIARLARSLGVDRG